MKRGKLSTLFVIIKKELVGLIRDKRILMTVLVFPFLLAPCVMTVSNLAVRNAEKASSFRVAADTVQQGIISVLESSDQIRLLNCSKDEAVEKIRGEELDVYLAEDETEGAITLQYNSASTVSAKALSVTAALLENYQDTVIQTRLQDLYGVPPEQSRPEYVIQYSDVYGDEYGSMILMLIPMVILAYTCYGVSSIAGEMTIAEKERQTMDPLLATGVSRIRLILGKNCVAVLSGWISGMLAFLGLFLYSRVSGNDAVTFSLPCLLMLVLIALILAAMFAEACILIGLAVKSFKEYQAFTALMAIVSMLPAFLAMNVSFHSVPRTYYVIPLLNHTVLIKETLTGHFSLEHVLLVAASTFVICLICWIISVRLIQKKDK